MLVGDLCCFMCYASFIACGFFLWQFRTWERNLQETGREAPQECHADKHFLNWNLECEISDGIVLEFVQSLFVKFPLKPP